MKNRVLSAALKSTAIVLMLLSAFAIAFPLMRVINGKLYQLENHALMQLEEKTGLSVSYESLSPAIISGLHFKGVDISDSVTDEILLHTESVKVGYRLWPLIHGRFTEAINSVTVDGLEIRFNDKKNTQVIERLLSLTAKTDSGSSSEVSAREGTETASGGFIMPFPVTLRKCSLLVEVRGMTGCLDLDSITLKSSLTAPYTTNIETKGNLSFTPDYTLTHIIPKLTTDLRIQAQITPDLNGTFGRFELKKTDGGAFSFKDVEFVAGMKDRQLSLSVFTPDAPYGVEAWWNMDSGAVHAELNATDFDPFTVITFKDRKQVLSKVTGGRIDGSFCADAQLKENGAGISEFTYDVDGSVYLPPGILKEALDVSVVAEGNLHRINVSDLEVAAKQFSFSYYGDVNVEDVSLSGYLKLGHYLLPSGKRLEGEFYIEDLAKGFSAFSPLIMLGDVPLTAVQLECVPGDGSADISFEAYDYSHSEADVPGHVQLDGSLLYGKERYLQASLYLENEYLDNCLNYAINVLPAGKAPDPALLEKLAPYILTCEAYGSTDFSSVSFNVPYTVVANTQKDGEMLLLSMDGNETTAQISQLELLFAGQQLSATVNADADEHYSQIFFSTDFTFNEMPYYFSGVYNAGKEIVVNGDYDFEFRSDLHVKNEFLCSVYADAIPIRIKDYLFSLSLDTDVDFTTIENFFVTLNRLELTENSGKIKVEPRVELTGFADRYGLMLETFNYGDSVSILTGDGTLSWELTKTALESVTATVQLSNPIGGENLVADISCSNPEEIPFADKNLLKELYVSGTVDVDSLFMSHFMNQQQNDDRMTVHGTVLGQLSNPFVSLDVPSVSMHMDGKQIAISSMLMLDDKIVTASDMSFIYQNVKARQFGFELSLEDLSGSGTGFVEVNSAPFFMGSTPVRFSFALDKEEGEKKIDFKKAGYEATLVLEDLQSNYDAVIKDYVISVRHDEGMWYVSAGMTGGISGFLLDSGEFYLSALADFPVTFTAEGSIKDSQMDILATDVKGNLSTLRNLFNDTFWIEEGAFEGSVHLGGTLSDPDFGGALNVTNLTLMLPGYITEPMIAPFGVLKAEDSILTADKVLFDVGNAQAVADLTMEMDRWDLEIIDVDVHSANGTLAPACFNMAFADCTADADVNIHFNLTGTDMSLTGSINTYNGLVELHTADADEAAVADATASEDGRIFIDLSIAVSQKAQLYYPNKDNPLVRGLVTTQTPVRIVMDSDTGESSVTGSLMMRGGEILYLNRNFYMRDGSIEFNETGGDFDPRISFRAEIRERDAEGELIKIILSADRQKLSELSPTLSSDPSKTENELRMLLGGALIVESGSTPGQALANVAASGFDFLLQNSLFRQVENRLRDLCNFDIFSFRTPFIQQALLSAMNNSDEPISLGNYFDNTTVYIGKYIGNTIYLDALLRLVYQKNGQNAGRLAFQPEVGLELPAPFATIRWSIAPDITSARNLWVPYTSISLSWSFKF